MEEGVGFEENRNVATGIERSSQVLGPLVVELKEGSVVTAGMVGLFRCDRIDHGDFDLPMHELGGDDEAGVALAVPFPRGGAHMRPPNDAPSVHRDQLPIPRSKTEPLEIVYQCDPTPSTP